MSRTINRPRQERRTTPRGGLDFRRVPEPWRLPLAGGAALGALLLICFLLGGALYTARYDGRIYRGVRVAGVALGGMSREEARERLAARAADWQATPLGVGTKPGERRWEIAPADLGVQFDAGQGAERAFGFGRDSNPLANALAWFGALLPGGGPDLPLPATLDTGRLDGALREWAPEATYYPTDATFSISDGGALTIVADKSGLGFEVDGSRAAFLDRAAHLGTGTVALAQVSIPAEVTGDMLRAIEPSARAVVGAPLTVTAGDQTWTLDPAGLGRALGYRRDGDRLVVALDPHRLGPFLDQLAAGVARPGSNARIVAGADGTYQVQPGREGTVLDREATLAAIDAALTDGRHEAALATKIAPPAIVAADLEPIRARLERIVGTPLKVTFAGGTVRTFARADLQPLITLAETPDRPEKVTIGLDAAKVRALVGVIATDLDQTVVNADIRWIGGVVQERTPSKEGREVQASATEQRLQAAILGASGTISPEVRVTPPNIASANVAGLTFPDRLGYSETPYDFSIAPRLHNVELAMERLNGAVVPPNGIFSFNLAVGEQTVANGYKEAYGIVLVPGVGGKPGQAQTVSSVGGGICQVATTLFQGVFQSGMPIEERNWHLYWPIHYGPPFTDTGLRGLDATVDDQAGLDFKFRNITGNWVAIRAVADGAWIRIGVYGTDPGWRVTIDDPAITDIIPADQTRVDEKTHDLPPGQTLPVEEAGDGFNAAIHRRVTDKNGKVVTFQDDTGQTYELDTTFKSNYLPSRNVWQVGVPPDEPLTP